MYAYQADTYCDSCGAAIARQLLANPADAVILKDDSDHFPQYAQEEAVDYPDHCASGSECLEAIDLTDYGLRNVTRLYGSEERKVGAILNNGLTEHGEAYLKEMLSEPLRTPYQVALHKLWREVFSGVL